MELYFGIFLIHFYLKNLLYFDRIVNPFSRIIFTEFLFSQRISDRQDSRFILAFRC
jgi:hypothetical protein